MKITSRLSRSKQHSVIVFAFNKEMIKRRPAINGLENRKGGRKINETKSYGFLEKKKSMHLKNLQKDWKRKKCEKTQITSFSNEGQTLQTLQLLTG